MTTWIKCSDRMPEVYIDVLVWTPFGNVMYVDRMYDINKECRKRSRAKDPLKNYPVRIVWLQTCFAFSEITHWMPLPEKPEDT